MCASVLLSTLCHVVVESTTMLSQAQKNPEESSGFFPSRRSIRRVSGNVIRTRLNVTCAVGPFKQWRPVAEPVDPTQNTQFCDFQVHKLTDFEIN
jgi:hypothetical protein